MIWIVRDAGGQKRNDLVKGLSAVAICSGAEQAGRFLARRSPSHKGVLTHDKTCVACFSLKRSSISCSFGTSVRRCGGVPGLQPVTAQFRRRRRSDRSMLAAAMPIPPPSAFPYLFRPKRRDFSDPTIHEKRPHRSCDGSQCSGCPPKGPPRLGFEPRYRHFQASSRLRKTVPDILWCRLVRRFRRCSGQARPSPNTKAGLTLPIRHEPLISGLEVLYRQDDAFECFSAVGDQVLMLYEPVAHPLRAVRRKMAPLRNARQAPPYSASRFSRSIEKRPIQPQRGPPGESPLRTN
jgi:hypothetical protein